MSAGGQRGLPPTPPRPFPSLTAPNRLRIPARATLPCLSASAQAAFLRELVTSCKGLARWAGGVRKGHRLWQISARRVTVRFALSTAPQKLRWPMHWTG